MTPQNIIAVIKTNWVHLAGFYISIEIFLLADQFTKNKDDSWQTWWQPIVTLIVGGGFLIATYGLLFIIGVYIALIILDVICFAALEIKPAFALFVEWIIITAAFFYWAFKYEYWLWLFLCASFAVTQYWRFRKIKLVLISE